VLQEMLPYFSERYGNPSGRQHSFGEEADRAVQEARGAVAELIGAAPADIVFTSGATESNNLAIRGVARAAGSGHLVVTAIEHAAVLEPCRSLEREGYAVTRVPVSASGIVGVDAIASALRPDTILVSVMAANNEVGTLQPVAEIGRLCRERGIAFHSDAVQSAGRVPVDVDEWAVDLMSVSAHKMYGPKGAGALYVRKSRKPRLRLQAQMEGGGQEKGLRSGTLNVAGIVGLGAASRLAVSALRDGEPLRIAALRDRLLAGLRSRIEGVEVNGAESPRLPGNLHVSIPRAEAETLILSLGGRIAISSGAACAEAGGKGSHVLRSLGLGDDRIYTAIRFGIGRFNTEAEIDSAAVAVADAAAVARARSSAAAR
jgi:cysteine desulfurase